MWTSCQWRSYLAKTIYFFFSAGTVKSYGVLMEETVKDFSTQHFVVGWAFALQIGTCFFVTPLVSLLQSNFDDRLLAICGGVLASLGYIVRGLTPFTSLWQLYAMTIVVGVGFGFVNVVTVTSTKATFKESFPLAHMLATPGLNVGTATMPLLLEHLMNLLGNDYGILAFGLFCMTIILTGCILPVPEISDPRSDKDGTTNENVNDETSQLITASESNNIVTSGEAKIRNANREELRSSWEETKFFLYVPYRHPQASFLFLTTVFLDVSYICWSIFLVPYGEYLGLDPETAVWLSTIGGSSAFVGRILSIIIVQQDMSYRFASFVLPSFVTVIGYLFSLFFDGFWIISLSALLSGLGIGMQMGLPSSVLPHWICDNCFKSGLVWLYTIAGTAYQLGAITIGGIVDVTGSYRVSFACLAGISFLEVIVTAIWTVIPPSKVTTCNCHD